MKQYRVGIALLMGLLIANSGVFGSARGRLVENSELIEKLQLIKPVYDLRVVTYNIRRLGDEMSKQNLWENRKPLVFDMIHTLHPDVIGFQEVVRQQLKDLQSVLADYDSFGEPRSAKMSNWLQKWVMKHPRARDEYNPIFYKKDRLELLDNGNLGINPTGRWGLFTAYLPRICTWGYFKDIRSGKNFYVYNTHLDNSSGIIRRKQIKQIMKHVRKHTKAETVIFMGDLNTSLKGKIKNQYFTRAGFVYGNAVADKVVGPQETRTGWNNSELKTIDHILIKAQRPTIKCYEVVVSPAGVFPSDHRPVVIDCIIK